MWIAIGVPILLSLPFLAGMARDEQERPLGQPVLAAREELALAA
jgi:hypothetical protein